MWIIVQIRGIPRSWIIESRSIPDDHLDACFLCMVLGRIQKGQKFMKDEERTFTAQKTIPQYLSSVRCCIRKRAAGWWRIPLIFHCFATSRWIPDDHLDAWILWMVLDGFRNGQKFMKGILFLDTVETNRTSKLLSVPQEQILCVDHSSKSEDLQIVGYRDWVEKHFRRRYWCVDIVNGPG